MFPNVPQKIPERAGKNFGTCHRKFWNVPQKSPERAAEKRGMFRENLLARSMFFSVYEAVM